jgi:hypothetical protein
LLLPIFLTTYFPSLEFEWTADVQTRIDRKIKRQENLLDLKPYIFLSSNLPVDPASSKEDLSDLPPFYAVS